MRYIVLFRATEKIAEIAELHDSDLIVRSTLLKYIEEDRLFYEGWHFDREGNIDNQDDSGEVLGQDETWFEVRCELDSEHISEHEYVMNEVARLLETKPGHVSNYHECDYTHEADDDIDEITFTKIVVEITIP